MNQPPPLIQIVWFLEYSILRWQGDGSIKFCIFCMKLELNAVRPWPIIHGSRTDHSYIAFNIWIKTRCTFCSNTTPCCKTLYSTLWLIWYGIIFHVFGAFYIYKDSINYLLLPIVIWSAQFEHKLLYFWQIYICNGAFPQASIVFIKFPKNASSCVVMVLCDKEKMWFRGPIFQGKIWL